MSDRRLPDRVQSFLAFFTENSAAERFLISVASLIAAVIVGSVVVLLSGWVKTCSNPAFTVPGLGGFCYDPIELFQVLLNGAFGNPLALNSPRLFTEGWTLLNFSTAITLKETTLLIFTGLAVAISFRAGLFNIGVQGQLVLGGLAGALAVLWTAPFLPPTFLGSTFAVGIGVAVSALAGGIYGAIPGALKAYADANEVITTIMLNFVATGVAFFLVSAYFKDPASQSIETRALPTFASLPTVLFREGAPFSIVALLLAIGLVGAVYYVLQHTAFGYDLRVSGLQPLAAEYGGVNAKRMITSTMTASGALAGIGGMLWVMMVLGRWRVSVPALGFDGITVSILAGNQPLAVIPAAFLFGVLKSGGLSIQFQMGVPPELIGVIRGFIILFVAMPEFFRMLGGYLDVSGGESP
ncbi:MAG: ABC transporter permease [Halodesulfurarchaeum sp.]